MSNIQGKRYLVACHCILNKALDKIKWIIGNETFRDTKVLFNTDNKLPDYITLENFVMVMVYAIKNVDKFYLQLFLKKALYDK